MNIAVYCAASQSNDSTFDERTEELGNWIAKKNHTLIYGGGNTGLMGIIATSVMKSGGEVIGVMPQFFVDREIAKKDITKLYIVENMCRIFVGSEIFIE